MGIGAWGWDPPTPAGGSCWLASLPRPGDCRCRRPVHVQVPPDWEPVYMVTLVGMPAVAGVALSVGTIENATGLPCMPVR